MIVFAHRGASADRVQNTLSAFTLARARGATCYELDVHLLQDGQLAVHHDYSLAATAGVDVRLSSLTAADLRRYPLQNPFTAEPAYVPLLSEVIPLITPHLQCLNIEIKNDQNVYPGLEKILCKQVSSWPAPVQEKILFSSFDVGTLQRLRQLAPTARIGLLTRSFDEKQARQLGVESVHINHIRLTPGILSACHKHGWKVFVYTVNDRALATQLQAQGVDGIFTDHIDWFLQKNPAL